MLRNSVITIFGGSGFVGTYLVRELAKTGAMIRVICRNAAAGMAIKTSGDVGQIVVESGSILDKDAVARAVKGSDIVINLVGVLHESGTQRFAAIQAQGAERVAKAAREAGVKRFIHMSALGVDKAMRSKYARTKLTGEKAVRAAFPDATIIRPSLIFGAEDQFFNRFAQMASLSPFLPLIGGGRTCFQPVYVVDVAKAMIAALEKPEAAGQIYELGGPTRYSFKELMHYTLRETGLRRALLPIPYGIAKLLGLMLECLPTPPLTYDQVQLLKTDNVVSKDAKTLADLGITPSNLESIVPPYLVRYRKGGQFNKLQAS